MKVDIEIITEQRGNPIGIGNGYARIRLHCVCNGEDKVKEIKMSKEDVTRNEFAIMSCVCAMKKLLYPCDVNLRINSPYIISSTRYVADWHANGWKRSGGKPVKNLKLWKQLYMLMKIHKVKFSELEETTL